MENKLKKIRLSKGLTQRQVGDMIGVSYSTIARWELGTRNISLRWVKKLAIALNVQIIDLM